MSKPKTTKASLIAGAYADLQAAQRYLARVLRTIERLSK